MANSYECRKEGRQGREKQGNGGERQCSMPCGFLYEDLIHMT